MERTLCPRIHPAVLRVQRLLGQIDRVSLPAASRRDVESILVRRACKEIDRALPWQPGHGRRTTAMAVRLAQAAGLDAGEVHDVKLAALLHDIGLLMLPVDLTKTTGPLETDAYVAVQNHSRLGANLLEPFSFLRHASILIAHHHERWDGSGYPYGIRGEFIPLGARLLAIADAYDAIHVPDVSSRAVRNLIATRILTVAAGSQFDPALVSVFCRLVGAGRERG